MVRILSGKAALNGDSRHGTIQTDCSDSRPDKEIRAVGQFDEMVWQEQANRRSFDCGTHDTTVVPSLRMTLPLLEISIYEA
jgi:hypothetical protein